MAMSVTLKQRTTLTVAELTFSSLLSLWSFLNISCDVLSRSSVCSLVN